MKGNITKILLAIGVVSLILTGVKGFHYIKAQQLVGQCVLFIGSQAITTFQITDYDQELLSFTETFQIQGLVLIFPFQAEVGQKNLQTSIDSGYVVEIPCGNKEE